MTRFYGYVGYSLQTETSPGVWEDVCVERPYYGSVVRDTAKWREGGSIHKDLTVANIISIIADPYAMNHIHTIRYVEWEGVFWSVSEVQVKRPRLQLRLGEVYNGPKPDRSA